MPAISAQPFSDAPDGSYFDNFELTYNYDSKCTEPLIGDLTGDCRIDFTDLAELAGHWLDCNLEPVSSCWEEGI